MIACLPGRGAIGTSMTEHEITAAERQRIAAIKEKAAILSVLASVALTLGKALGAWLSGSLALTSEAMHGLIDIAATVTTWLAIRAADRPADEDHHYGHGKIESLAALAESALLFALAGAVAWEAAQRLWTGSHPPIEVTPLVVGILLVAILIDGTRWRALHRVARDTNSEALEADATHFASDFVSSALTLAGLIVVLAGYKAADAVAALAVSAFIVWAAMRLAIRTIGTLLDAAPRGLRDTVEATALAVPGVEAVDWIRLRPGGGRVLGEVGVKVSRTLPLEHVAAIKQRLSAALAAAAPAGSTLTITANPVQTANEKGIERVMTVAARLGVPVHHIGIHQTGTRSCISLDMEVDSRLTLAEAHDRASRLEAELRAEFGPDTEVETHVEPLMMDEPTSHSSEWAVVEEIGRVLAGGAADSTVIRDIHNVRVRSTGHGLVVNFHCRAAPDLDIAAVHAAVDQIERGLRKARPDIARVVGHAEPLR